MFDILSILNAQSLTGTACTQEYKDITLDYRDIVVTVHNKYTVEEIQELATGLMLTNEVQQPLALGRVNGEYWLVSGHRRLEAIKVLIAEGHSQYERVSCRYKDMTETQFRIELLCGNTFNRKMKDYDLMIEAQEWKSVLVQAKKEGLLSLGENERIRDYVASILGESTGKIGQLEAINNKATPEVKEKLKTREMGITSAYAASQLPEDKQAELVAKIDRGEDIKSEDIQRMAEEEKRAEKEEERERKVEQQRREDVSDTDTNEDEKAHAKRLHVIKRLERYYTYMSDEELELLERILEDCKRRKREYSMDEE